MLQIRSRDVIETVHFHVTCAVVPKNSDTMVTTAKKHVVHSSSMPYRTTVFVAAMTDSVIHQSVYIGKMNPICAMVTTSWVEVENTPTRFTK